MKRIVRNTILISATFIIGAFSGYHLVVNEQTSIQKQENIEQVILTPTAATEAKALEKHSIAESQPNNGNALTLLQDENKELKELIAQLDTRLKSQREKVKKLFQSRKNSGDTKQKLSAALDRNKLLEDKLIQYEPDLVRADETISDEQLAEVFAELPDSFYFKGIPASRREVIVDYHQQPEDLDEGYALQQKISDFIHTHPRAPEVTLTSLTCKQTQCELYIEEKVTRKNLLDQGYKKEEIMEIQRTQDSAQKTIINDLRKHSTIVVRSKAHLSSYFYGYYLFELSS